MSKELTEFPLFSNKSSYHTSDDVSGSGAIINFHDFIDYELHIKRASRLLDYRPVTRAMSRCSSYSMPMSNLSYASAISTDIYYESYLVCSVLINLKILLNIKFVCVKK